MKTEVEIRVLELLKGGRALSLEKRREILARLSAQERDALRRIAAGEIETGDPRDQRKAVTALGMMPEQTAQSRTLLRSLVASPNPSLQIKAIQGLAKQEGTEHLPLLRELVRAPTTHPGTALAAARVVAARGGPGVVDDLLELRRRFLPLVPNERSPSIVVLDQLIRMARDETRPPTPGEPRPIA